MLGTFEVHLEPTFASVPAWVCLAWSTAMKSLENFHSLVLDKVAALLIAVDKVESTREANDIVAITLEVVNLVTEV